ncbi:hypothetical protein BV898_04734 [Hypsibius exemplaris]|uniref:Uncharacterized protein n=1 Tax=Hypsibius exemplaris TaxID=2072580 RepID=A0A1W0X179_HYPEX|nr:hypothetical protein BV898_04734 [Hypsibius exemplaris]
MGNNAAVLTPIPAAAFVLQGSSVLEKKRRLSAEASENYYGIQRGSKCGALLLPCCTIIARAPLQAWSGAVSAVER